MKGFKEKSGRSSDLPSVKEKRKQDDAIFKILQQMIENVKNDPQGRSELVDILF